MKNSMYSKGCCLLFLAVVVFSAAAFAAVPSMGAFFAGSWQGSIMVPDVPLAIEVSLQRDDRGWSGRINIPAQGVENQPLDRITTNDSQVSFTISGIAGEPRFSGTIDQKHSHIVGEFVQNAAKIPFALVRARSDPITAADSAERKKVLTALNGRWEGVLRVNGDTELHLALVIEDSTTVPPRASLISVDQGGADIPVSGITVERGSISISMGSVGAKLTGTFDEKHTTLAGTWIQSGGRLPIKFTRVRP